MKYRRCLVVIVVVMALALPLTGLAQDDQPSPIADDAEFYGNESYFMTAAEDDTFDFAALHVSGESLTVTADFDEEGNLVWVNTMVLMTPTGTSMIIETNEDGLPASIYIEDQEKLIQFENYTGETADVITAIGDGSVDVQFGVPIDADLLSTVRELTYQRASSTAYVSAGMSDSSWQYQRGLDSLGENPTKDAIQIISLLMDVIDNLVEMSFEGAPCIVDQDVSACASALFTVIKIENFALLDNVAVDIVLEAASVFIEGTKCQAGHSAACIKAVLSAGSLFMESYEAGEMLADGVKDWLANREYETLEEANEACQGLPDPRLAIGGFGRKQAGRAINVRSAPTTSASVAGLLNSGMAFSVLAGPACDSSGSYWWWLVQTDSFWGWTAEAIGGGYVIEPITREEFEAPPPAPSSSGRVILVSTTTVPVYGEDIFNCGAAFPIAEVPNGTGATILNGPRSGCGSSQNWYYLQVDSGVVGWVSNIRIQFP